MHIVALGASAGGLNALEQFFDAMPSDSGMAFVVIQHLSPDFKSLMDDLLRRHTSMAIKQAADGILLEPDTIYLAPPRFQMGLEEGRITLRDKPSGIPLELAIDTFFRSLAADAGNRVIAVILSGTGSDGSRGIRAVREVGGLVLVQSPESSQFDGMPRNAIATGCYDFQLPPERMPKLLIEYAKDPEGVKLRVSHTVEVFPEDGEYASIFALLRRSFNVDFSKYKTTTVERRIQRRIELRFISSVDDYVSILTSDPDELDVLYRDLLIGVTEFFRDAETFEYLSSTILPTLVASKNLDELRVWSACCATGEEAYSLAIVCAEVADNFGYNGKITIFATDIHKRSLETASIGIYGADRLSNVSPERLSKFFRREMDDSWRVNQDIRKMVVFAPHNIITDPPFTKTDLVCCRNTLIYLKPEVQERVINTFHYALKVSGVLFLGKSEGLGSIAGEFETVDSHHKLFRKKRELNLPMDFSSSSSSTMFHIGSRSSQTQPRSTQIDRQLLNDYDQLLASYIPAGILVNEHHHVLHAFGDLRTYVAPFTGRTNTHVQAILVPDLHVAVNTTLQRCAREGVIATLSGVHLILSDGQEQKVSVSVRPIKDERAAASHYYISFTAEEFKPIPLTDDETSSTLTFEEQSFYRQHISDLEMDLRLTRENLQAANEELQTSNEELQATNEELLASNEELQSTNEELHSVNEELFTVNSEFERKNAELKSLNLDHENLLTSIDTGTIFVDNRLCIRKFNSAVSAFFRLVNHDIGRPIEHIAYHLSNQKILMDDIQAVLASGIPVEREDSTPSGSRHILIRILPFRNDAGKTEGVVILFTDITRIKEAELTVIRLNEELQEKNIRLGADYELERSAGEKMREELRLRNEDILESQRIAGMSAFKWDLSSNQVVLSDSFKKFVPMADISATLSDDAFLQIISPDSREQLLEAVKSVTTKSKEQLEIGLLLPNGTERHMSCHIRRHEFDETVVIGILHDITEQVQARQTLIKSETDLRARLEAMTSPDVEISTEDLVRVFDAPSVQEMMNDFFALTRTGIGIIDLQGRVLVATGWQRVCTDYFRKAPATLANCHESDMALTQGVIEGEFKLYRCKNGMWDMVTPLMAEGKHFANIFLGQFFFDDEQPDYATFERQAEQYGFDRNEFMAALKEVPVWSRERVNRTMSFYARFASLIAKLSVKNLRIAKAIEGRNQAEERLRESQKMEAIGVLAGGIAHDFNNILQTIIGHTYLMKENEDACPNSAEHLDIILTAGERAADLTRGLLAYSRRQNFTLLSCNLVTVVNEALRLFKRLIGEHIELEVTHTRNELMVKIDAVQINQVLMNLITNARDAMPKGGLLRIETGRTELENNEAEQLAPHAWYSYITITDNGTGMTADVAEKIFEPFFTTKEVGKGTGLGLSVVYGIVKQHEGFISCNSEPGRGTQFKLLFPLNDTATSTEKPNNTKEIRGGTETILVVEDESAVRGLLCAVLNRYGYRVFEATNGKEALDQLAAHHDSINLLISDIVMPTMNGIDLYNEIKTAYPELSVLFMSGYPMRDINLDESNIDNFSYLEKPISPTSLLQAVRTILDEGQA